MVQMKKAELLANLRGSASPEQHEHDRKVVLVVDEAQNLSQRVLEEVRLLSGVEATKEEDTAHHPGRTAWSSNDKLDAPELEQLAQRIRLRFHLTALTMSDTRAYILHRLEVAGSLGREIFTSDTFDTIYRFTGGVPRLINTLCDTAMLAASNDGRDMVTLADVRAAINELQWIEHSSRTGTRLMRLSSEGVVPASEERANGSGVPTSPYARILLATSGQTISTHPLYLGRLIIGRTAANDLQIESRFVSRHHCQIVTTPQSCVIEDLNSTNGIFVHGKRVRLHNLNDGDVVSVGQHELLYVDERPQLPSSPEEPHSGTTVLSEDPLETSP